MDIPALPLLHKRDGVDAGARVAESCAGMIRQSFFLATLLASSACSAQPQASSSAPSGGGTQAGASAQAFVPPQPPEAAQPVPKDAPLDRSIKNVPATTGRANLPESPPPVTVTPIGQFDAPFAMAFLPDGALLVTEKAGKLKLRAPDGSVSDVIGLPPVEAGGQGGLLDVAVAPDFSKSRTVFWSYAEPGANGSALALAKGTLQGRALSSARVIWRSGSNGPGGQFGANIAFSPDGQFLFLSSGERQRFTPAQDPAQLIGKVLRLTLDGQAAPGNPNFAKGGAEAMIWTSGHRNPYGLVFTPDGRLWEEEMGPKGGDELNLLEPGKNYGWPTVSNGDNYSGQPIPDHPSRPEFAAPVLWWNPSISPGGMIHYSGAMFPQWKGSLFIGALGAEGVVRITLNGATAKPAEFWTMGTRIRDLAQAPDGAIWALEDGERGSGGRLLRLTAKR
ncbi:glucose/arabinose dehydrogenase [Sphingomonas aerophila]|uniref:Glucose/arabinose dehydrogenase n=2 Tax=Sphingomonas aerophila TaxID=1344948 RepID=A0A7W9EUB3_9SPHN|nr:glucose/arabinose dehydrogenase [Sphingomonas aerophila]